MLDKTEQSERAPNPNDKSKSCYCSALPKGSGLCLPCYTRWLAGRRSEACPQYGAGIREWGPFELQIR
jgi:hypothetical protein